MSCTNVEISSSSVFVLKNDALPTFSFPLPLPSLPAPNDGAYRCPKLLEYRFLAGGGGFGLSDSSLRKLDGAKGGEPRLARPIGDKGAGGRFIVGDRVGPGIGKFAMPTEDNEPPTPPPNEALLPPRLPPEGDADARVLFLNGCTGLILGRRMARGADGRSAVLLRPVLSFRKRAAKESPEGGRLLLSVNDPDVEPGGRGTFLGLPLIIDWGREEEEGNTNRSAIEVLIGGDLGRDVRIGRLLPGEPVIESR